MAKFETSGIDNMIAQLEGRGKRVSGVVNHMLNAGAKIMKEEQQQAMKDYGLVDTGDMMKSVKSEGIKTEKGGGKSVDIAPQGIDRKGQRNMTKAMIAHYGVSGKQAPRPWKTLAEERGFPKVQERMQQIFEEEMDKE